MIASESGMFIPEGNRISLLDKDKEPEVLVFDEGRRLMKNICAARLCVLTIILFLAGGSGHYSIVGVHAARFLELYP